MKHTIVAIVDNKPGVVSRISGMFTRRGYNIESFVTSVTGDESIYHLTFTVIGTQSETEQLISQLGHVSEVIEVYEMSVSVPHVTRELMFVRVACPKESRPQLISFISEMNYKAVGESETNAVVEVTGEPAVLDEAVQSLSNFGEISIARSGAVSILI